uniref:Integrase, catalytic region, zinc finger, CCHC-type, peptidase aspartic, catalytic n=1 Tax=Tanacetum cinerariifolium TaxID=118510 RepID=A0A6L2LWI9_TANCI|nr:hypothetical protein [Tanacetum cinerariifolium]
MRPVRGAEIRNVTMQEKPINEKTSDKEHYHVLHARPEENNLNSNPSQVSEHVKPTGWEDGDNSGVKSFANVVSVVKPSSKSNFRPLFNEEKVEESDFVLSAAVMAAVKHKFDNTLVGFFVGQKVAFPLVKNYVTNTWNKFEQVLQQGQWMIRNTHIILNKWTPNLSLAKDETCTLVVRSYSISDLSYCAGSELPFLASSGLKLASYRFLKTLDIQYAGFNTRPPMLDRTDFASWQQRIRLYCRGKENGVNILKSIDEGPFQIGTFRETLAEGIEGAFYLGLERPRIYSDLSPEEKERYSNDIQATNILLQGLPKDIYTLINHYTDAKVIWDNVKMLLEGSELTKKDRKSQLYDDFEHFHQNKGETIHDYYGRFVIAVKLNKGLRDSNYDQLYAYPKQHEAHAIENKMMLDRFTQHTVDPLALMTNGNPLPKKYFADSTQLDSGLSPTDNLIENLTNTLTLFTQSYKTCLPQINNQLITSSNTRNQATVQDGRVVVQNVQGRRNRGQGNNARGSGAAGCGGAQNRVGNANTGQARQIKCYNCNGIAQENGVALDKEQLLFITGGQDNANDCDAFDYDVDEAPTAQTMFMENLSSADPVYDKASPSYDSDILSEVPDHDNYQDADCEHHEVHEMHEDVQPNYVVDSHTDYMSDSNMILYDQYVKDNTVFVVQSNVSSVSNDAYVMIINEMHEPSALSVSANRLPKVVNASLTAELATYKEQVELYERWAKFELTEREQKIKEQLRIVYTDRNIKEENLKKELYSVKMQLTSTINHNKLMVEEVTSLKKNFKQKENKFLEEFLDMKALKEKARDKLYKQDQSLQTVHMLCKLKSYYDEQNKVQSRGNTIRELREKICRLTKKHSNADPIHDLKALDSQNKELHAKVNALHDLNERWLVENEKVKRHYKIKENHKLNCVTMPVVKSKVLAPGMYVIDVEPILPRNKNNREVHLDYLQHLKESVATLREIVEEARVEKPLDSSFAFACLYTKHS